MVVKAAAQAARKESYARDTEEHDGCEEHEFLRSITARLVYEAARVQFATVPAAAGYPVLVPSIGSVRP
jgi:hypothetical protein